MFAYFSWMELNWNNYAFVGYLNGGGDAYILFFINVILNICQTTFWTQNEAAQCKCEAELNEFPGPLKL